MAVGLGALALPSLLSFAPGILAGLFGDPKKKLRKQLSKLSSPNYLGGLTNQFYQQGLASPMFAQGQGNIAAGANATQGQLAATLGARGIGSGSGDLLSSLIPSITGSQLAGLRSNVYQGAQGQAQNAQQQQISALLGTQGPSPMQQGLAGGFEAFMPFLQQYLGAKYPSMFGQNAGQAGPYRDRYVLPGK